jgi:SAM-dependent methyltransferase
MAESSPGWLADFPEKLRGPLERCVSGEAAPHLALMQLLIEVADPAEAERSLLAALAGAGDRNELAARRLRSALMVWRAHPDAWAVVRRVVDGVEHGAPAKSGDPVAHWAATFDRAVRASPEGSVALYSLGSPKILAQATAEIVALLGQWGLLGPGRTVLDLGCGIGRMAAALAPQVDLIVGLDISAEMLAAARARCAKLSNVEWLQGNGRDLALFEEARFDLMLAVDCFPYLVLSGLAAQHVQEAARVLRPGGSLVVFNYSYRADLEADRREIAGAAASCGLQVHRNGTRDLTCWDGVTFHLVRRT